MIRFDHVTKSYGDGPAAVDDLSFTAPNGQITVLVGPSGCGKTTSLRMINRLIEPSGGRILLDGEDTARLSAVQLRRRIGYVIQHAGLFPHLTVEDNIAELPMVLGAKKREARARARELLELVGLDEGFAKRYPAQLSGGQQQRVGVARALAADPPFMIMDEPFSAVDPIVRVQLQDEFLSLQRRLAKTIVMVTHDIDEALKLGDHIVLLRQGGVLAQEGAPVDLLRNPNSAFVAEFLGSGRGYRALGFLHERIAPLLTREPVVRLGDDEATVRAAATSGPCVLTVDDADRPIGWAHVDWVAPEGLASVDLNRSATLVRADAPLREVLDGALSSPAHRGVIVGDDGVLEGTVTLRAAMRAVDAAVREEQEHRDAEALDEAAP